MDEKRMGQIALILVRFWIRRQRISLDKTWWARELENAAKDTGLNAAELKSFVRIIVGEAVKETYGA